MLDNFGLPPLNGEPASIDEVLWIVNESQRLQTVAKPAQTFDKIRILHEGLATLCIGDTGYVLTGEDEITIPFVQIRGSSLGTNQGIHEYTLYMPEDMNFQSLSDHDTSPSAALAMYDAIDWTTMPEKMEKLYHLGKRVCALQAEEGIDQKTASHTAIAEYLTGNDRSPMATIKILLQDRIDLLVGRFAYGFDLDSLGTILVEGTTVQDLSTGNIDNEAFIRHLDIFGNSLDIWSCSDGSSSADEIEATNFEESKAKPIKVSLEVASEDMNNLRLPCDVLGKHQFERIRQTLGEIGVNTRILSEDERLAISEL